VAPLETLNAGSTTRRQTTQKHDKVLIGIEVRVLMSRVGLLLLGS
jgi:hypothetical protein